MSTGKTPLQLLKPDVKDRVYKLERTKAAYLSLVDDDDNIDTFLSDETISKQEFVDIIALRRIDGSSASSGGGNRSASNQTDRLYANTQLKFIEEFLQNADDCRYEGTPELKINVNETHSTIEFVYNESGFTRKDVWALTEFEGSTKSDDKDKLLSVIEEGVFYKEKTGRKGMGFKSVFTLAAENVIVHIRSNGFSFKLDGKVSHIVPIWEDAVANDGLTHVTVELVNPKESLKNIYPTLKELFGAKQISNFFQTSPLLFMHRIHNITVTCTSEAGVDSFSISNFESSEYTYNNIIDNVINPESTILSGIKHNGTYYRNSCGIQTFKFTYSNSNEIEVPCYRKNYMVNVARKWRVVSFVAPVMRDDKTYNFKKGSLFRTFPLFNEKFDLPLAIDAPYELCTNRQDLEFTASAFNIELSDIIFKCVGDSNSLLEDFYCSLRVVPDIRIDYYLPTKSIKLYDSTNNRDQSENNLVPIVDLRPTLKTIPLLHSLNDDAQYVSLQDAYVVDSQLYLWPHCGDLLSLCSLSNDKHFVAYQYKGSSVITKYSLVKNGFCQTISRYLDRLEEEFSTNSMEFLSFVNRNLYPYLIANSKEITSQKLWNLLPIYISQIKHDNNVRVVREAKSDYLWRTTNQKNNLSFGKFRIIDSSPVEIKRLIQCVKEFKILDVRRLDLDFASTNISNLGSRCHCLDDALDIIKAGAYYGFPLSNLKIDILNRYAISETYDPNFNPFREAKIVAVIPDEVLNELSNYFNDDISATVDALKKIGICDGASLTRLAGNHLELKRDTITALHKLNDVSVIKLINQIFSVVDLSIGSRLSVSYKQIESTSIRVKNSFLRRSNKLSKDSVSEICCGVLNDDSILSQNGDECSELISRAWFLLDDNEKRLYHIPRRTISIEYCIQKNILGTINRISNKTPSWLEIITNGDFLQIPESEAFIYIDVLCNNPEEIKKHKKTYFYYGLLHDKKDELDFLADGIKRHVFLNADGYANFRSSLQKYIGKEATVNQETVQIIQRFSDSIKNVRQQYILPYFGADEVTNEDIKEAFADTDKEAFIKVLSYCRREAYKEVSGNTGRNSDKEVISDYKDHPWKFIYEFIQNVDDCSFDFNDKPSLEIEMTKNDGSITFTYNEKGFTADDILALTSFDKSQKVNSPDKSVIQNGIFNRIKTGKLGRGFKSVFALPGNNITVHVQSNGYSFYFHKSIGAIVPIWEKPDSSVSTGTRITVKGLKQTYIDTAYKELVDMLSLDSPETLFSKCPILYLRKLQSISVSNGEKKYSVFMSLEDPVYSEDVFQFDPHRINAIGGIRCEETYRMSAFRSGNLIYTINNHLFSIPILQYSMMVIVNDETRLLSATVPLLNPNDIPMQGGFYCILPLSKIHYAVPISIDAPFSLDSGRQTLIANDKTNATVLSLISSKLLPNLFAQLRSIDDIHIAQYIPTTYKNNPDLENYKFNLTRIINNLSILKLQSGNGFTSPAMARLFSQDVYSWPYPEKLSMLLRESDIDVLANECYLEEPLNRKDESLLVDSFVLAINMYLDYLEEKNIDIWPVINEKILPYIEQHYTALDKLYYNKDKRGELKKLRVFGFTDYNGNSIRVDANDTSIWINEVSDPECHSFGDYRVLNNAPVIYNDDIIKLIEYLGKEILPYRSAFTPKHLSTRSINTWDKAKQVIETLLYYRIDNASFIPYLRECLLDEAYDSNENLFLTAYKETHNTELVRHYITAEDMQSILKDMASPDLHENDVITLLKSCGLRKTLDMFEYDKDSEIMRFSKSGLLLLKIYCSNKANSDYTVSVLNPILEQSIGKYLLHVKYDELKDCRAFVFASLFESKAFMNIVRDKKAFSRDFLTYVPISAAEICAESMLAALPYAEEWDRKVSISISLQYIINNRLGSIMQKGMLAARNHSSFALHIITSNVNVTPFSSDDVNKALEWLDDDNISNVKKFKYFKADIAGAFNGSDAAFLFDDECVYLPIEHSESNQYNFISKYYSSAGDSGHFRQMVSVAHDQKKLQEKWLGTKKQYIDELGKFRKTTNDLGKFLYPNLQNAINQSTGAPKEYIVPELLQNINDCHLVPGKKDRALNICINSKEQTMRLEYDEAGFDFADVYSITALGQSSKHDEREGEKGLGFKKVFTLFDRVEIHSNGFHFALTRKEPTIPQAIDPNPTSAKTTMIFHAMNVEDLNFMAKQWSKLFVSPYTDPVVSPLFLENIGEYTLQIGDDNNKHLTRNDIEKLYFKEAYSLLRTYQELARMAGNEDSFNDSKDEIYDNLRTRLKCQHMSDTQFETYVNGLSVTILFPKRPKDVHGRFYSTLPTKKDTHTALFINLPLELTTARDDVLSDSAFNCQIFELFFGIKFVEKSISNYIFEHFADSHNEVETFTYLIRSQGSFEEYLQMISNLSNSTLEDQRKAMGHLNIFHQYKSTQLVPMYNSYIVEAVLYQYIHSGIKAEKDLKKWLQQAFPILSVYHFIDIKSNFKESCELLQDYFASTHLKQSDGWYPFSELYGNNAALMYFADEYGSSREEV